MNFMLHPDVLNFFPRQKTFDHIMRSKGEVFRELEGRRTQRIILGSESYFLKQHFGIGWKEIFKNLLQLRLPVTSAQNEQQAINKLQSLKIPTLEIMGFGQKGINPARKHSFLLTRELHHTKSLEDLAKEWIKSPPSFSLKREFIKEIARIARIMHQHGMNHRDFYICHFLVDLIQYPRTVKLYLIDLHRAQIRIRTPLRWRIKDLAGLYFSSKTIKLTQRDYLRFIKYYSAHHLREILITEIAFWQKVKKRGEQLYNENK